MIFLKSVTAFFGHPADIIEPGFAETLSSSSSSSSSTMVDCRYGEFWSAMAIREAIIVLEEGISTAAASVSTAGPGGCTVTWTSRDNYKATQRRTSSHSM